MRFSRTTSWPFLALLQVVIACSEPGSPTGQSNGPNVSMLEGSLDILIQQTGVLTVVDGSGTVVTSGVVWSSSDTTVAVVDETGAVTGVRHGGTIVEARLGEFTTTAAITVTGFIMPIAGVINEDFFFHGYADQAAGPPILDYNCGEKTYDGHKGVDIVLRNFAQMDDGVDVLAAARGTVTATHDGEFDRHKEWQEGVVANSVVITHARGYETRYLHFKRNSVAVTVGQEVTAGTVLGQVGSSGRSSSPHLHLELTRNGQAVGSFAGPCGPSHDYWAETIPYQDEFHLLQLGVTGDVIELDDIKEGLTNLDTLYSSASVLLVWYELHNVQAGDSSAISIRRPDGSVFRTRSNTHRSFSSRSNHWWYWTIGAVGFDFGTWTVEYSYDGVVRASKQFEFVAATAPVVTPSVAPAGDSPASR